jgi:hypothetical protein
MACPWRDRPLSTSLIMATTDHTALARVFDRVPTDLAAYFDEIAEGSFAARFDIAVNLLPVSRAVDLTVHFLEFHPIIKALSGFALDDGNTSNHHFYLSESPLDGMVLFLSHDGDTRVVYPSLDEFVGAARTAKEQGLWMEDMHPPLSPVATDQAALSQFISQNLDGEDADMIIPALIPSMDLHDLTLLRRLAGDDDFFLGEAVAIEISKRPSPELREVIALCLAHRHPQVVNTGQRARDALAGLG